MDPFSDVLRLLEPKGYLSARLRAGGAWALRFQGERGVKFNALLSGECWLAVDGEMAPQRLRAGDCWLLARGRPYRLASDLGLAPLPAGPFFQRAVDATAQVNDGDDALLIGGRIELADAHAAMLLDALPALVHVPAASEQAGVIQWVLGRLAEETRAPAIGAALMTEHLVHMLFVEVLRNHVAASGALAIGWLGALADPRLAAALALIHGEPTRRWTVDALAAAAGMSRSSFAERFKSAVGAAPLDYLLRWRMRLALRALQGGRQSVSSVALSLGYESESGFSHAFRRVMGHAPRHFKASAGTATAFAADRSASVG